MGHRPSVVVIAGPNGAGKTTVAPLLLQGVLGVTEFVNADAIGHGLSAFFELYRPLTSMWRMYDTSREPPPRLIAAGRGSSVDQLDDADAWRRIEREIHGKS